MISLEVIIELGCIKYSSFWNLLIAKMGEGKQEEVKKYLHQMSDEQMGQFLEHLIEADACNELKQKLYLMISEDLHTRR